MVQNQWEIQRKNRSYRTLEALKLFKGVEQEEDELEYFSMNSCFRVLKTVLSLGSIPDLRRGVRPSGLRVWREERQTDRQTDSMGWVIKLEAAIGLIERDSPNILAEVFFLFFFLLPTFLGFYFILYILCYTNDVWGKGNRT